MPFETITPTLICGVCTTEISAPSLFRPMIQAPSGIC
jgi:hypothetical protein